MLLLLLVIGAVGLVVGAEDPALLEYSDYYYDLYYGDYDYQTTDVAPRTIRVENHQAASTSAGNGQSDKNNRKSESRVAAAPVTSPPLEPLNVRLQRILEREDTAARIILDILSSSKTSQDQIHSFLSGIVGENEQVELNTATVDLSGPKTNQGSRQKPKPRAPKRQRQKNNKNHPGRTKPTLPPTRPSPKPTRRPTSHTRPAPPPTKPTSKSTRPPPPPTRPPPPPTRPPPPPTRPPPPPTRPPPPPTRPPPPPTRPPPPPTRSAPKSGSGQPPVTASKLVNQQFSQFPNFQSHQKPDPGIPESPRSSSNTNNKNNFPANNFNSFNGFENESPRVEDSEPPSSGLTIQEFLSRYPEVKRLSSRFNQEGEDLAQDDLDSNSKNFNNDNNNNRDKGHGNSNNRNLAHNKNNNNQGFVRGNKNENIRNSNKNNSNNKKIPHQQSILTTASPSRTITPKQRKAPTVIGLTSNKHQNNNNNKRPNKKQQASKNTKTQNFANPSLQNSEGLTDYDYASDYDYYYDQLVPEHERFFQLPKISTEAPTDANEKSQPFQIFTHFAVDSKNVSLNSPKQSRPSQPKVQQRKPEVKQEPRIPKAPKTQKISSSLNSLSPVRPSSSANMAGPFGYTDKGSFFIDDSLVGFPERIEIVYQGFVWAMNLFYPDQAKVAHGGVHRILQDKVKREKVSLKDDHIVRVTGRASPYNINKLTFYTAAGKVFGPWGERFSEESEDFDVSAPPGQALAFFSGTIDFGVPLRSIGFHWAKI